MTSLEETTKPPGDELLVDRIGHVLVLTLNRPRVLNSLNTNLIGRLGEELVGARTDPDVRAIVVTGAGDRAFCVGTDLRDAAPVTAVEDQFSPPPLHISRGLEVLKPVIAAVNGYALGGGLELALACDLRIASTTATFGLPEPALGTMPGAGGTQRLVRQIPRAHAMHLLLTGERIPAERAERWGLVSSLHEPERLREAAVALAERIAANAPLSTQAIKQAVTLGEELPLADAMRVERAIFNLLRDTTDRVEGREAFREKRTPHFSGR